MTEKQTHPRATITGCTFVGQTQAAILTNRDHLEVTDSQFVNTRAAGIIHADPREKLIPDNAPVAVAPEPTALSLAVEPWWKRHLAEMTVGVIVGLILLGVAALFGLNG